MFTQYQKKQGDIGEKNTNLTQLLQLRRVTTHSVIQFTLARQTSLQGYVSPY